MHIEWGEQFSVHVAVIDEQHRETIRLFNLLDDIAAGQRPLVELASIVDATVAHLKHHIATEEHYFDEFGYEHAGEHKLAHRSFLAGMQKVLDAYRYEPVRVINNVMPLMRAWLEVHTALHDKKYADCFHQHGLDGGVSSV